MPAPITKLPRADSILPAAKSSASIFGWESNCLEIEVALGTISFCSTSRGTSKDLGEEISIALGLPSFW